MKSPLHISRVHEIYSNIWISSTNVHQHAKCLDAAKVAKDLARAAQSDIARCFATSSWASRSRQFVVWLVVAVWNASVDWSMKKRVLYCAHSSRMSSVMASHIVNMHDVSSTFCYFRLHFLMFSGKTVTAMDIVYALKRQGRTIYGFGS